MLFDLPVGGKPMIRPDAECGYAAAHRRPPTVRSPKATSAPAPARRSASSAAPERPMKGGIGTRAITLPDGVIVAALVAVNAVGDIIDPATGKVVAGTRTADGKGLADVRTQLLRPDQPSQRPRPAENTTLGGRRDQRDADQGAGRTAWRRWRTTASRAPSCPSHTCRTATRSSRSPPARIGGAPNVSTRSARSAPEDGAGAIVRAVRAATSIPGYPAARDIK